MSSTGYHAGCYKQAKQSCQQVIFHVKFKRLHIKETQK